MIAVAPRRHADSLQIGAGVRLGQRQAAAHFAGRELRQPVSASAAGRAELLDRERQHQMRIEDAGDRHPHAEMRITILRIGDRRQPQAAILRADRRAEQPEFLHLLDDFRRIAVRVVVFLDDGPNFLFKPAVDGVEQQRLVGQIEIADRR